MINLFIKFYYNLKKKKEMITMIVKKDNQFNTKKTCV